MSKTYWAYGARRTAKDFKEEKGKMEGRKREEGVGKSPVKGSFSLWLPFALPFVFPLLSLKFLQPYAVCRMPHAEFGS